MKSLSENDIKLSEVYVKDIRHVLRSHLATDASDGGIIDAKLIFLKQYSDTLVKKVKSLISSKCYFLLPLFPNDDLDPIDEENNILRLIDSLYLYSFSMNGEKYYLMYSIKYANDDKLKSEFVEFFTKVLTPNI